MRERVDVDRTVVAGSKGRHHRLPACAVGVLSETSHGERTSVHQMITRPVSAGIRSLSQYVRSHLDSLEERPIFLVV